VDTLDETILALLRREARLTMAELGRRVGLSRTATLARVRRLEDEGVIRGYHAEVAPAPGGQGHAARVGIVVRGVDTATYAHRLARFPELQEAESVTGEVDLLVRFAAEDAARLDAILDQIHSWPETVRTTTQVVLTRYPVRNAPRPPGG
jgi:Lrp/AsnC family transcriptional regulator, leucine-responsive regulatory protein